MRDIRDSYEIMLFPSNRRFIVGKGDLHKIPTILDLTSDHTFAITKVTKWIYCSHCKAKTMHARMETTWKSKAWLCSGCDIVHGIKIRSMNIAKPTR